MRRPVPVMPSLTLPPVTTNMRSILKKHTYSAPPLTVAVAVTVAVGRVHMGIRGQEGGFFVYGVVREMVRCR